ncbi:pimeloyl-ACP methyl ester carboxylesterase [Povalibacter uvarum]|uniref:Pimeloyl-ACP methyl ester carboxylesterase n=1 Tax=Povalibacter uvarum TaxID=732238 RepID=A0A841HK72_9GAMM|nr:alpha/beta hydrolase [Povalibacter uvarum]MBB6092700.1 pimeloyl-ACP methyl ester carboxylesterase [Povalibacter uvarum]
MTSSIPSWFAHAIEQPVQSNFADVDGARIHYLTWNAHETHKPGMLLAHGFRAHARWWSLIAPFFTEHFRVAALDFAGMGDSDHRKEYSSERYVHDLVGVIEHAGLSPVTLIGHSFGGSRVVRACADFPHLIERAVVIDSFIPVPELVRRGPPPMQPRPKNVYPTYEAARARFRLVPEHNCTESYILDYIAHHSMKQVEGGWAWKFDEHFTPHRDDPVIEAQQAEEVLKRVNVPMTLIYGEKSIVSPAPLARAIVKRLSKGRGPIEIPESHHHVLLDQPLSLVSALRAVLSGR